MFKIKKTFLIICMLLCAAVLYSQSAQNKDVLYYNNNGDEAAGLIPLSMKNGVWMPTVLGGQYEPDNIVVDRKNGFISYSNGTEECGYGGGDYQIALFTSKAGHFIARSVRCNWGSSNIAFWKVSDKKWTDATSKVLPSLNVKEFFADCYKNADWNIVEKAAMTTFAEYEGEGQNKSLESYASLVYELPRYGTDIKVKASLNFYPADDGEEKLSKEAKKALANIRKKSKTITLSWDTDKGKLYRKKEGKKQ